MGTEIVLHAATAIKTTDVIAMTNARMTPETTGSEIVHRGDARKGRIATDQAKIERRNRKKKR